MFFESSRKQRKKIIGKIYYFNAAAKGLPEIINLYIQTDESRLDIEDI